MGDQTGRGAQGASHDRDDFKYAPEDNANVILFHEVCTNVLERMRTARTTSDRLNLLKPIWTRVGKQSTFPFLRLLLPQLDSDRTNYGLKTTKLAKLYANMYFDQKSEPYQRLVHHTDPLKNPSPDKDWQIVGDFPLTLEYVLQNKPGLEKSTCTLKEVNDLLDELKRASNDEMRKKVLAKFHQNFSPMNQKWLVRIILRDLKIHLKKDTVLKKIHEDALDEYNRTTSLRKVFTAFFPMLAKNFHYNMARIIPSFQGRPFCMDVKLDGERMLCHREGNKIKWLTRNAKNYTDKYGPVLDRYILDGVSAHRCILDGEVVTWDENTGSMVPFGHNRTYAKEEVEGKGTGTRWLFYVVFDILYAEGDGDKDKAVVDEIIREAAKHSRAPCAPGTLLKGGNITALPLDARLGVLRSVVTEQKHRLEIVKSKDVEAGDENERKKQLGDFFEQNAVHLNEEGLVVKDLTGHYEMGEKSRNSGLWVKMKPEYSDESGDMDLIVLAAGYANGQMRSGFLSKFLIGVAVPTGDGSVPTEFKPVTTVGSGFTMQQLEDLNERTRDKWQKFDDRPSPHVTEGMLKAVKGRDGLMLTRWIHPGDSFCLEVKCMELVKRADWPSGCQMRFPRITRIRFDKGIEGCLRITELHDILARPRQRPSTFLNDTGGGGGGKRRRGGRGQGGGGRGVKRGRGTSRQVSSLFAVGGGGPGGAVEVKDNVFITATGGGIELVVLGTGFYTDPMREGDDVDAWWKGAGVKRKPRGGGEQLEKQQMDELIKTHGGSVVANANLTSTAFIIVGDTNTVTVKNIIDSGKFNVVGHRWVMECIKKKKYEFPSFQHLRAVSPDVRKYQAEVMDDYGDSYTQPIEAGTLSQLLLKMSVPSPPAFGNTAVDDGGLTAGGGSPLSWLSGLMKVDPGDKATLTESPDLMFADTDRCHVYCDVYEVAPSLHEGITHVVVDPLDNRRFGAIAARVRELHGRPSNMYHLRVVTSGWVEHCIELGRFAAPNAEHLVRLSA